MDDQGEGTAERLPSDIQFHWNIRSHRHGSSGSGPARAIRGFQTLLSCEHVPALGAWMCMYPRTVTGPHDSVREYGSVTLRRRKLEWSDDRNGFTTPRSSVFGPEFGEPDLSGFLHHNSRRTLSRFRRLPVRKRAQMPVDRCLIELKSGDTADVEAAKLRPLLGSEARPRMPPRSSARVRWCPAPEHAVRRTARLETRPGTVRVFG